ncbi:hypothetical protein [Agromyces bracchium]|uniref:Uncharacterized protein n=1 Tax=Agromyces bracchium TaxID=88376 RepID=A0A6I3M9T0_9MICO|nr:hypothetical protein [Agromyces bracchium]MTH70054.1 hypothetical protein [Agromyces bracchium]
MTEPATEPQFDPRFDPRFQRGWSGQAADAPGAPDPSGARRPADVPAAERAAVDAAAAGPVGPVTASDASGASAAASAPGEARAADAVAEPAPEPSVLGADDPLDPAATGAREASIAASTDVRAASGQPVREPAAAPTDPAVRADIDRILRVAFGIAWSAVGVAFLVGVWAVWLIVGQDPFAAPRQASGELALRSFAYLAGPSLLSTAVVGVAILAVVDGVRRARSATAPERRGGAG